MNYCLVVLTHGDNAPLEATLDSFLARVTPGPTSGIMLADGCGVPEVQWPFRVLCTDEQVGFCGATRAAWKAAAESDADYVFHLEHDFQFLRDVDLRDMALVLDHDPFMAQMALMRTAVNDVEKEAGGLFESRPGQYDTHSTSVTPVHPPGDVRWLHWLTQRSYLTTNPSLMRRDFMVSNPWPGFYDSECEGKFGIDLLHRGYHFGVWGEGDAWVEHVGVRTGFGY